MTEENYNYRTSPMFLRNQFKGEGKWKMPVIPKVDLGLTSYDDQRLIGYDKIKTGKDEHYERIVHFFLYDYKFEDIWTKPDKYIDVLKKYKAVLSPDYSMYIEMNSVMQLYNTFRNRWVGAYLAEKGIKVIPTVSWVLKIPSIFVLMVLKKVQRLRFQPIWYLNTEATKTKRKFS